VLRNHNMLYTCQIFCLSLLLIALHITHSRAYVLGKRAPRPALAEDFPDPSIVQAGDIWYAFATQGNGVHVQVATSTDFDNWSRLKGQDALPNLPSWVDSKDPSIWAPNIIKNVRLSLGVYASHLSV
jgi:beta-xylosidase